MQIYMKRFLVRLENGRYKISIQSKDHYYRKRFTMAHELAHFLFHSDKIENGINDNKMYRSTPAGDLYNNQIGVEEEIEANKFAAAVLMPEKFLKNEIKNVQEVNDSFLEKLSRKLQVSKAALKIRIDSLKNQINETLSN